MKRAYRKRSYPLDEIRRFLEPGPIVLVSSVANARPSRTWGPRDVQEYQRENSGDEVIIHAIPQDAFVAALKAPSTMIISDGLVFPNLVAHPRSSGTSARVLGPLVREQKLLTLMEALRKMTLMPAQRLEAIAPAMKNKGRVRVGADADLAIFDPGTVADSAKFGDPAKYSVGFRHVLVAGVPVVSEGTLQTGLTPGRAVRGSIKN